MRPTTKDLAQAAGVSLATVDRVLNDRPNVSSRSREKVLQAITVIGFVRNLSAVNLVKNRIYTFRFVFPTVGGEYLQELIDQAKAARVDMKSDVTDIECIQLSMQDPHDVANYLANIEPGKTDGIAIMAPASPPVRDAIARLDERGVKVVQFLSGQEKLDSLDFVGADNIAAGATAGSIFAKFLNKTRGKIMVIADTMHSLNNIQRRLGFDRVINECPALTALPTLETHGDKARAKRIISRQLEHDSDIVAVYVISSEARTPIEQLANGVALESLTIVVHERTPFTERALLDNQIDAVVAQNPGHAVRSTLRILRARSDNREIVAAQEKIRIEILLKDNL
ncbi:MAG: LacI family DNA-binding transcriptional regulator [Granulosicoccaceae bacterium]